MKVYNIQKSRIYLTGYARAKHMTNTLRALGYMLQKHGSDPSELLSPTGRGTLFIVNAERNDY